MSRTYYHTPCKGFSSCASEKEDKRLYNRKFRRKVNQHLFDTNYMEEFDNVCLPLLKEVSDVWDMGKDGKCFFTRQDFYAMYLYFIKWSGSYNEDFYTYCRKIFKK